MRLVPETAWDRAIVSDQGVSVQKILDGTLRAIATVGTRRLSMSDIIHSSGVARATLYRYFTSKEDVLAAVSEYVCTSFERGIAQAAASAEDPMERFRAVMRFYARFTIERSPERIFEVEPTFHLEFLRTHFGRHTAAVAAALAPCIDYLEGLIHVPIDREIFAGTLVRLQLSTLIVPASSEWVDQWNSAPDTLLDWVLQIAGRSAEPTKG